MSPLALVALLALQTSVADTTEENHILETVAHGARPDLEKAINRIQYLGQPLEVVNALVRMAGGELPGNPENAIYVLAVLHPPQAAPAFLKLLGDDDGAIRLASCQGLSHLKGNVDAAVRVGERLADPVPAVRRDCAKVLVAWPGSGQSAPLTRALAKEQDPDARLAEIEALGRTPGKGSAGALEPLLQSKSEAERFAAAKGLALLGAPSGRKALEGELGSLDASVRADAVALVASLDAPWSRDALASRLDDPNANVCIHAAKALADRKDPRGVQTLVLRAERASPDDKFAFESALSELHVGQAQRLDIIQKAGAAPRRP